MKALAPMTPASGLIVGGTVAASAMNTEPSARPADQPTSAAQYFPRPFTLSAAVTYASGTSATVAIPPMLASTVKGTALPNDDMNGIDHSTGAPNVTPAAPIDTRVPSAMRLARDSIAGSVVSGAGTRVGSIVVASGSVCAPHRLGSAVTQSAIHQGIQRSTIALHRTRNEVCSATVNMFATRRRRLAFLMLCSLVVGAFVLRYRGPGRAVVRGHLGDVAVVALLYWALAWLRWGRARTRLAVVGLLSVGTELFQAMRPALSRSTLVDLTVGRTFDPVDLAAYVLGLAVAFAIERRWVERAQ